MWVDFLHYHVLTRRAIQKCVCECVCVRVRVCSHVCVHARACVHACVRVCVCTRWWLCDQRLHVQAPPVTTGYALLN